MASGFYYKTSTYRKPLLARVVLIIFGVLAWTWSIGSVSAIYRLQLRPADYQRDPAITPQHAHLWKPRLDEYQNGTELNFQQDIRAALSVNFETGEVYYAHNTQTKLPIASLTKIMTAIVALDHSNLEEKLTVPATALDIPEDSSVMGVSVGESYTVGDLLYGLLLPSGNDAANAIAEGLAHSKEDYVYWMNRRARSLGLHNTRFANPSGLDDPDNFSTAFDLAVLAHYAITHYPPLEEIVASRQYEIPYTHEHKYLFWGNFNDLMLVYEGVDGIKPGNTEKAGSCLIATATRDDRKVMTVVLGATYRNAAAIKLLDLGFQKASN